MWHRRSGAEKAKDIAYLSSFYWSRMVATAGCWFFWDFSFYGNRVFQSAFITILTGGSAFQESCHHFDGRFWSPCNSCAAKKPDALVVYKSK